MIKIIIVLLALASQMKPGTAEMVIHNRQIGNAWVGLPKSLPVVDGYVAMCDCSLVGDFVWIQNPINQIWERHLIIDCCYPGDGTKEWMEENNIFCELDYDTTVRWNTVGRGIELQWTMTNPTRGVRLEP